MSTCSPCGSRAAVAGPDVTWQRQARAEDAPGRAQVTLHFREDRNSSKVKMRKKEIILGLW